MPYDFSGVPFPFPSQREGICFAYPFEFLLRITHRESPALGEIAPYHFSRSIEFPGKPVKMQPVGLWPQESVELMGCSGLDLI